MAAGPSSSSPSKKPCLEEEEHSQSKSEISLSEPKYENSRAVKEQGSPQKEPKIKKIVKGSFINDEEESEKELSEEDIEEEADSIDLLAEISEEPSKRKAGESSKQELSDDDEKEDDKENRPVSVRKSCPYGSSCYRKNPVHRKDEAHPGDGDYKDPDLEEEGDDKPECEYGTDCYRKNPQHRKDFQHTRRPQRKRAAAEKVEKKRKKKKTEDDCGSNDSFIDDDDDGWEPVDDSDDDADFEAPADMSSDFD